MWVVSVATVSVWICKQGIQGSNPHCHHLETSVWFLLRAQRCSKMDPWPFWYTTFYREVCLGKFCHSRTQDDSRGKIGGMIYNPSIKVIETDRQTQMKKEASDFLPACSPPMGPDKDENKNQSFKKKKVSTWPSPKEWHDFKLAFVNSHTESCTYWNYGIMNRRIREYS